MAKLAQRVQTSLDEGRILLLGTTILLGFGYRAVFEPRWEVLPGWAQTAKLASLGLMIVALALLVLPTPWHRLVERGEDTPRLLRLASFTASAALLPFALALGLDLLVATARVEGLDTITAGAVAAGAAAAVALLAWYAWPLLARRPHRQEDDDVEPAPLERRIRHVLTEARMVLPGAQALLGFQLAVTLMEAFEKLPHAAQLLHLANMALTALAVVLLVAPAAFHRLAEGGEETERVHRVASRLVVASMVPLALALSGELALVAWKVGESARWAAALGLAALVVLGVAWFGVALVGRRRAAPAARVPAHA
jgi:hypothetical protein